MGVFKTAQQEEEYVSNYCLRCVHYGSPSKGKECPVMNLHALYMCRRNKDVELKHVLDTLIPISNNKQQNNEQCAMYRGKNEKLY